MKFGTNSEVNRTRSTTPLTRRKALTATSTGIAAALAISSRLNATEWTSTEKANAQIVTDFCAAWPSHNLDKVMSFFASNAAYRVSETQEPEKGKEAVRGRIKSFLDRVKEFEVLDTLAKGPMVFNERIDHFTGGPLKSWHGVGVFFLKEGRIVEWYDYTIALDRA
jgi:limonene-1,2-epoxide hydrolase